MIEILNSFFKGLPITSIETKATQPDLIGKNIETVDLLRVLNWDMSIWRPIDSFAIEVSNTNGSFVDLLKKDTTMSVQEHIRYLIQKSKSIHHIIIDRNLNLERIVSHFYDSSDIEFAAYTLEWHPGYLDIMPIVSTVYNGDFLGNKRFPPKKNTKILLKGYSKINERNKYFRNCEFFDTDPFEILIYDHFDQNGNVSEDYSYTYDPSSIVLKEKLFEL